MRLVKSLKRPLKKQSELTTSNVLSTQSSKSDEVGQTLTDVNRLGDLAEHYAITWLWDEGFEVFYNAGSTGAIDIVGIKDNEVYLFDVKSNSSSASTNASGRTQIQKDMGVQYIIFDSKTRRMRLQKHQKD